MCNTIVNHKVKKTAKTYRRTAVSIFVGGLFCSAAPAWADCLNEGTNANGGLNITCEGADSQFDRDLVSTSVSNNTVTIQGEGTTIDIAYGGYNSILTSNGDDVIATGNTVILNSISVGESVTGGYASSFSGNATATRNTVILNDSRVSYSLYGGYGIYGSGSTNAGTVTGNIIILNGSSSAYDIYGGFGYDSNLNGDTTVTGNTVTLNGSSSAIEVYGGHGRGFKSLMVTNNTININDTATISDSLYGGFQNRSGYGDTYYDAFTGNTLNFAAAPITLSGTVTNFENYNFTVDPALVNTETALITADTITFGTNDTNMKGGDANTSKIKVVGIKAGNELFANDKFVLMQATGSMSGAAEGLTTNGIAQQGISLLYDVKTTVDLDGKLVTATIIGSEKPVDPVEPEKPVEPGKPVEPEKPAARVNPQLKSLSEGHLAAAMMITRGADTIAYDMVNTIKQQNTLKGWAPFINLSGDKTRYNSGSHINAKDALLTGGLSYQQDKLTSGVFIESGWGSYDTHNSFTTMNSVKGDGHNRYLGLGVLGRYDFESGVYADASLRGGQNRNTFDTKDIQNLATGERVHYNLDSNYLSAHVGTGYTKALDEKNTLDVSAKYLWTQLKGKDVKIAGDNIHFDDINSHRVRLNTGLAHQYSKAVQLRAGLGYEYEFDGKAKATTYGYDIAAPSVQGSTGILSVGATMTPMANQAFSIDVNANGYTGQRDGIGGNIKFNYAF